MAYQPRSDHLALETAAVLSALQARDGDTFSHCDRTRALCVDTGKALGLSSDELVILGLAAELHDVGKIGVPDRILLKSGRLDDEEARTMRTHCRCGHNILSSVPTALIEPVAAIVLSHHEAVDGSGYPEGLKAEEIPPLARIVSIVDSYDAIAAVRPYHAARSHAQTMQILYDGQGRKYDPYVLATFAKVVEFSPYRVPD